MPEWTTCPRQREATMLVQLRHRPHWRTDTWSRWRIWMDRLRDRRSRIIDWLEGRGWLQVKGRKLITVSKFYGGRYWPDGEPKPRTCSYCASVHPDDAIALLERGWEVEGTGKSHKRYLHPPGYYAHVAECLRERKWPKSGRLAPVPPVKLYVHHMTPEQIARFNTQLLRLDTEKEPA